MGFFEIISGRALLEAVGGVLRFAIDKFLSIFNGKNVKPISTYFKKGKDEVFTSGVGNHIVGVIFFGLVILVLIFIMSPKG